MGSPLGTTDDGRSRGPTFWFRVVFSTVTVLLIITVWVTRDPRLIHVMSEGSYKSVHGILVLDASYEYYDDDKHCRGFGDFSDVTEGADLTLSDDGGHVPAVYRLGPGSTNPPCVFEFTMQRVALGAAHYTFAIAGSHPIQVQPRDLYYYVRLSLGR